MTLESDVVDAGRGDQPLLETRGLTKAFGAVEVLSDISLAFHAGEVHAIIGENGAGKSTLMKIISGHLDPTRGSLRFDGAPLTLRGPVDAERRGIVLCTKRSCSPRIFRSPRTCFSAASCFAASPSTTGR